MLDKIGQSISFYKEALNLRAVRHSVLASNLANAQTPGYKARDIDFNAELSRVMQKGRQGAGGGLEMAATQPGHLSGKRVNMQMSLGQPSLLYRQPTQVKPDGNSVDMDMERTRFLENSIRYQSTLQVIGSKFASIKNGMTIQ